MLRPPARRKQGGVMRASSAWLWLVVGGCDLEGKIDTGTSSPALVVPVPGTCVTSMGVSGWGAEPSDFRGVSIGANSGLGHQAEAAIVLEREVPEEYLRFLERIHAQWVMIPVAIQYDYASGGSQPTALTTLRQDPIDGANAGDGVFTWNRNVLRTLVAGLKDEGYRVALSITLEPTIHPEDEPRVGEDQHLSRLNMGHPNPGALSPQVRSQMNYNEAGWFWDGEDAGEQAQIGAFWDQYEARLIDIVQSSCPDGPGLCPDMIVLGTESDYLFRSDAPWAGRIQDLMLAVNGIHAGSSWRPLYSYTARLDVAAGPDSTPSVQNLWQAHGLDVVSVSAYPQFVTAAGAYDGPIRANQANKVRRLVESNPGTPDEPDSLFKQLETLKQANACGAEEYRPVVLGEFGFVDRINAAISRAEDGDLFEAGDPNIHDLFGDEDTEGTADGEQSQSWLIAAILAQREACDDVLAGVFVFNNPPVSSDLWTQHARSSPTYGVRQFTLLGLDERGAPAETEEGGSAPSAGAEIERAGAEIELESTERMLTSYFHRENWEDSVVGDDAVEYPYHSSCWTSSSTSAAGPSLDDTGGAPGDGTGGGLGAPDSGSPAPVDSGGDEAG